MGYILKFLFGLFLVCLIPLLIIFGIYLIGDKVFELIK